jgi:hypothetical protein
VTDRRRGISDRELQRAEFRKVDGHWQRRLPHGPWLGLVVRTEVVVRRNGKSGTGRQKMRNVEVRTWTWE